MTERRIMVDMSRAVLSLQHQLNSQELLPE
jgi:hypothetical protein